MARVALGHPTHGRVLCDTIPGCTVHHEGWHAIPRASRALLCPLRSLRSSSKCAGLVNERAPGGLPTGLAMRRIADLYPGNAKIDARDALVIADAARTLPHTLRAV